MSQTLRAFGRGVVKFSIALTVGVGVGLVIFGGTASEDAWMSRNPPPEIFLAVGAGMLTTGVLLGLLFFLPRRAESRGVEKPQGYAELPD